MLFLDSLLKEKAWDWGYFTGKPLDLWIIVLFRVVEVAYVHCQSLWHVLRLVVGEHGFQLYSIHLPFACIHTHTHTHTHHIHTHTYTHTTYTHTHTHTHTHTGLRVTTQNGFMNGLSEEGHTDADVYPVDGPLPSGTQSLRRIKSTTTTARMMSRVRQPSFCWPSSVCLLLTCQETRLHAIQVVQHSIACVWIIPPHWRSADWGQS